MKPFDWNKEKNEKLKKERGISFEQLVSVMIREKPLDLINNPSARFPNQKVYVVRFNQYIYYIPFVENEEYIFLKTIIPSRKLTKKYINKK